MNLRNSPGVHQSKAVKTREEDALSIGRRRSVTKKVVMVAAAAGLIAAASPFVAAQAAQNNAAGKGTFELCNESDFAAVAKFDYGEDINKGKGNGKGNGKGQGRGQGQGKGGGKGQGQGQGRGQGQGQGRGQGQGKGGGKGGGKGNGGNGKGQKLAQDSGIVAPGECSGVENIVGLGKGAKAGIYGIDANGKVFDIGDAPFVNNQLVVTAKGSAENAAVVKGMGGDSVGAKAAAKDTPASVPSSSTLSPRRTTATRPRQPTTATRPRQ